MVVGSTQEDESVVTADGRRYRSFSFRRATEAIRAWEEAITPRPEPAPEREDRPKDRTWRRRSARRPPPSA